MIAPLSNKNAKVLTLNSIQTTATKQADAGESKSKQKVTFRYNIFLIVSSCYFFVDIGWGLLYEHRHIDSLYPFLYFDCLLYFFFMFLSMLTWITELWPLRKLIT